LQQPLLDSLFVLRSRGANVLLDNKKKMLGTHRVHCESFVVAQKIDTIRSKLAVVKRVIKACNKT
jgi:hypothetical protein